MSRTGRGLLLFAALALLAIPASPAGSASSAPSVPYVMVEQEDRSGVSFAVRVPPAALEELATEQAPGRSELPVLVTTLGLPDDAVPRLSVTLPSHLDAAHEAAPRATLEVVRFRELRLARVKIYPLVPDARTGELVHAGEIRVRVEFPGGAGFAPPGSGPLGPVTERIARRHLLNRDTAQRGRSEAEAIAVESPAVTPKEAGGADKAITAGSNPGVKIRVDAEGLVQVTRAALEAAGFDPSGVEPRNLALSYRGTRVPCRVTGESDGVFDPADVIEFWGVPGSGRFSLENVYWLEEEAQPGLRFPTADATPGGATPATRFQHSERYEEGNSIYTAGQPAQEGDEHFFWAWFEDNPNPPRVTTLSHSPSLVDLDTTGTSATMRASFLGRTDVAADPDHQVRFFVNGNQIGDSTWNGKTFHTAEVPFSAGLLVPGTNTFRIDFVSITFPDIYYLDWVSVEYPRLAQASSGRVTVASDPAAAALYDVGGFAGASDLLVLEVSDPFAPTRMTGVSVSGAGPFSASFQSTPGGRYALTGDGGRIAPAGLELDLPSDLRNSFNAADLIVIVPEGWEASLAALVAHREAQGLRVELANLTDVADEFAGGNVCDMAIRDFVAYAYQNWLGPPVSYLLLVGEPNRDARNLLGQSPFHSYMPTHLGVTDSLGETETDTWFGAVVGGDLLPDVAVGRFSARSASEAAAMATKHIDYESGPPLGVAWGSNVLQVASNEQIFETSLEAAGAYLPPHFTVDSEYRRYGANSTTIRNAFDAGALLSSFLGHGNVTFWADSPGGPFWDGDDVNALVNAGRLGLVTALNCVNGLIGHPTIPDSLGEVFQNRPTDGALAVWVPAALGYLGEYDVLQSKLYDVLFQQHESHIGSATTTALVETYLGAPVSIDLVKEMILLGDPAGWLAVDGDSDLVLDHEEVRFGLDPEDRDTDDDGLTDDAEGAVFNDFDADGMVNAVDPDADNDGVLDGTEAGLTAPDTDTDVSRGYFVADADPLTTTDPLNPDSDGGGAPDGVEDINGDGQLVSPETDPLNGADDATCSNSPVPEVAVDPGDLLTIGKSGDDLVLSWGDERETYPCILYRVYVADDYDHVAGRDRFRLVGVTGQTSFIHLGAAVDGAPHRYVIAASMITSGEGPWGHFGY